MNVVMLEFGTPALSFARSCKAHGISVYLLEPQEGPVRWQRYSSCLSGASGINPDLIGTPEGLLKICDFVESVNARALMVTNDKMMLWLSQNREMFEPDCAVLAASDNCLQLLFDKQNQIEIARKSGFNLLPSWYLRGVDDADSIPQQQYPVCVRPSLLGSVDPPFKAEVLHTPEEMKQFLRGLSAVRARIIAQPFIVGPTLVVHGARSAEDGSMTMRAFMAYRKHEGFTLALKPVNLPKELSAPCRAFAEASDITGVFHYELLVSEKEGRPYFLEVNVRLGGTTDKVMRLGFDEPAYLLRSFGIKLPRNGRVYKKVERQIIGKRLLLRSLRATLTNTRPVIDYPRTSRSRQVLYSIFAWLFVRDSVLDWSDVRGSLWYLLFKRPHTAR